MVVGFQVKTNAASVSKGLEDFGNEITAEVWRAASDLARKSLDFFREKETQGPYIEHYRRRTGYGLQRRSGKTDDQLRRSYEATYVYAKGFGTINFSIGSRVLRHDEEYTISRSAGWIVFPGDDAVDSRGVLLPEFSDAALIALREQGLTFWMPTKSPTLAFIGYREAPGSRAKRIRVASKKVTHPKRVSPEQHFTFAGGLNQFFNELADAERLFDSAFKDALKKHWPQGGA